MKPKPSTELEKVFENNKNKVFQLYHEEIGSYVKWNAFITVMNELKSQLKSLIADNYIEKRELRRILFKLDWKEILYNAIKNRPTSWNENPVLEWRNASDTILSALLRELEKRGVLNGLF